jgi:protein-glutamine gamma-glutamyltransferase
MNLSNIFRALVLTQVILGLVAFTIAERNPVLLLVVGGLAALSWAISEGPTGRPLPHWAVMIGAMGAVAWLLVDLVRQQGQVPLATGHFIMWLQVVMLYGKKTNREYGELLVLSVLLMVSASAFSAELIYGVMLIGYCVLTLFTVLVFHLKVTTDGVAENNRRAAPDPALVSPPNPVRGRGYRWHFRATALGVGAAVAGLSALIFIAIPRSGDPSLNADMGGKGAGGKTGFSARVSMSDGGPGEPTNRDPVLHFYLEQDNVRIDPASNPDFKYLLRGAMLDSFDPATGIWQRSQASASQDIRVDMKPDGLTLLPRVEAGDATLAIVQIRRRDEPNVFTFFSPDWAYIPEAKQMIFNPVDRQIAINDAKLKTFEYRVNCLATKAPQETQELLAKWQQARAAGKTEGFLKPVPELTESELNEEKKKEKALKASQIGKYARGMRAKTDALEKFTLKVLDGYGLKRNPDLIKDDNDPLIAQALCDYLQKNYEYKTDSKTVPRGKDPVLYFLEDEKSGHCERFAGALAGMARSVGMTARVVTGFLSADYNTVGKYYLARQSNAHAWVEIYDANLGWITFDPTPASAVSGFREPMGWGRWVNDFYDHYQYRWISTVITYDSVARERVMGDVTESMTEIGGGGSWMSSAIDWAQKRLQGWQLDKVTLSLIVIIMLALAMGVGLLVRIAYVRRQRMTALQLTALPRAQRRQLASRLKFYLQMLDMLERHGYNRPSWQSPFGYAKDLAKRSPAISKPVVQLTELFYEIRFGYRDMDAERKEKVATTLQELEKALMARA